MDAAIRSVKFCSGHTLTVWDDHQTHAGKAALRYTFLAPDGAVLFCGSDFGASPCYAIDSDATLMSLLGFLTLKPGDTDAEYFAEYTDAQLDWARSSDCESLACDISVAEELKARGCVCGYVWTENLDTWTCEDAPNVAEFQFIDHGEDGSQYFSGCGTAHTTFAHVVTGTGDTAKDAFEDAMEMMAQADPEARLSLEQEDDIRRNHLPTDDRSAHAQLEPHDDCESCDWAHRVSIRYNLKPEAI